MTSGFAEALRQAVQAAFETGPRRPGRPQRPDLLGERSVNPEHNGATPRLRLGLRQLVGPAGTLLSLVAVELCLHFALPILPAVVAGFCFVLLSAFVGGFFSALLSAAMMAVHHTYFLFVPDRLPYAAELRPFVVLLVLAPALALVPGYLRAWWERLLSSGEAQGGRADASFLAETSDLLDTSIGYARTLAKIAELAVPTLADWCAIYMLSDSGDLHREFIGESEAEGAELLDRVLREAPLSLNQRHPLAGVEEVLLAGQSRVLELGPHTRLEPYARTPSERVMLAQLTPVALVAVPLQARGRLIGAMVFARARGAPGAHALREFRSAELVLAEEFCRRAGLAADTARLYDTAINARREAELARERVVNILESISDGFMALDHEWAFTYVNREAERLLGRSRDELIGTNIWRQFPHAVGSAFYREYHAAASSGAAVHFEAEERWSPNQIWLEVHAFPSKDGLSVYFRDVSARKQVEEALKRSEEQLRHSQKMEAVGRLAGGVAHDFNNLLTSIAGYAELLLGKVPPESPLHDDVLEIQKAAGRAGVLTRQLLAFGRKQVHAPQVLDLNDVVRDLEKMLRRLIDEDIVLRTKLDPGVHRVSADPGQVEQIIMNLAVNARDAMSGAGGGVLMIESSNVDLEHNAMGNFTDTVQGGAYVMLSVSDTGCGMDAETLSHIFEPFFTTKEKGKGTGLGLATVYGIVKQSRGNIAVYSKPSQGARFEIYLPCVEEAEPVETLPAAPSRGPGVEPAGEIAAAAEKRGTILVAEDEGAVRRFVCKVLRHRGYTVLEAENGVEALDLAGAHTEAIDLLLSDVIMPEMGGRELASRLGRLRPDTRIVFMSGYAENEIVHEGALEVGTTLIEKPFSAETLALRISDILADDAEADASVAEKA
jgi:PAS domain S-box-containing protein